MLRWTVARVIYTCGIIQSRLNTNKSFAGKRKSFGSDCIEIYHIGGIGVDKVNYWLDLAKEDVSVAEVLHS